MDIMVDDFEGAEATDYRTAAGNHDNAAVTAGGIFVEDAGYPRRAATLRMER